ncbi:MAG: peptidoglycan DD-metalloendopeptidase family protein [Halanaerobiales bacterium]
MKFLKKICNYLFEGMNITVMSSPVKKIKNYKIRRIYPFIVVILTIATILTLSSVYLYYQQSYYSLLDKHKELQGVKAENQLLKKELFNLAQETESLKENLYQLQNQNHEIKKLLKDEDIVLEASSNDIELKLHTMLSEDNHVKPSVMPAGGADFYLNNQANVIINRARSNIDILRNELPQQEESLDNLEMSAIEYNRLKAATPSIWPLLDKGDAFISSNFGWRADPFTGKQQIHEGIDIGVWYNTPVVATADGIVTFTGSNGGYGITVTVEHEFAYETLYAHLNKVKVKEGQKVSRGDIIALSGNSGRSSGPHLHYEVRVNGIPQEPRDYIGGI